MSKILITGAAGFIGYHLSNHLLANPDNQLTLVDNLQRGKMDEDFQNLLKNQRVIFIEADLTDPAFYQKLALDFDQIYHLAAVNGTKFFYQIPQEVLRINTLTLIYLLEWVKKLKKKPKVCFTSSNEAYAGALAAFGRLLIPTPENVPLVISDTYNPRWSYGGTKLIGELFLIHYAKAYDFPALIVRPHNFYGPRAGYDHVIPEFCQKIMAKTEPFVIFSPKETRTFCYIADAIKAMQMLMDSDVTSSQPIETVHIGNIDEITMKNLAEKMFQVTDWRPKEFEIRLSPAGSVMRRLADITKIQKLIGWQPETPLEKGLTETFLWYKEHLKKSYANFFSNW